MLEYLAALVVGFWLGAAALLFATCRLLDSALDKQRSRRGTASRRLVAAAAAALHPADYEELLTTAILNKVVERCSSGRSSGIHSASATPQPTPTLKDEEVSDWEEGDATEDAIHTSRPFPYSEFAELGQCQDNEYRDFDEVSGTETQGTDGTWEENWLFQKKRIKNLHSVPVPMLVPNSTAEFRALIGDRDADDTTDLSDNASDETEPQVNHVFASQFFVAEKTTIQEEEFQTHFNTDVPIDEKLNIKEFSNDNTLTDEVDSVINKINIKNNIEQLETDKGSILLLDLEDGPLEKAEFSVKEEIHRLSTKYNNLKNDQVVDVSEDTCEDYEKNVTESGPWSLSEREREYEEAETSAVQRRADSLRRKHFSGEISVYTSPDRNEDVFTPGSIAERERKKWLNYVEMPNNPYSPEAINRRLSAKSVSSIFDHIVSNTNNNGSDKVEDTTVVTKKSNGIQHEDTKSKECNKCKGESSADSNGYEVGNTFLNDFGQSDDENQLKCYRIGDQKHQTREFTGRRKTSSSDTMSLPPMNKSADLDNFESELALASTVSASSSLSDLEASALHHNIVRAALSPRNGSPNFAINPLFENPDSNDEYAHSERHARLADVRMSRCAGDNGRVDSADTVRLKIPNKPEVTEDLFEPYINIKKSDIIKSENACFQNRLSGHKNTFGGSLRLSKGFETDLW